VITGSLEQAITASSNVLAVRGQVLPATLSDVRLWAELTDGRRIQGESNITKAGALSKLAALPQSTLTQSAANQADYYHWPW